MTQARVAVEALREMLTYEAETGRLYWLNRPRSHFPSGRGWKNFNTQFAGKEAFTYTGVQGYREGRINNRTFLAHRVIYALQVGSWPEQVDHIDGDRANNRWANLRAADQSVNSRNAGLSSRNVSGRIGVSWDASRRRWTAQTRVSGVQMNLGRFERFEDACAARSKAERDNGFHPNHGRAQQQA